MPNTIYVCGKCGQTARDTQKQLRSEGWLVERKRDAPKGELVIRCQDCRTVHSERLAKDIDPAPIFDLDYIEKQLAEAEPYTSPGADDPVRSVFVGTVFSLYPSRKYYVPFACSNVSEVEAEEDEAWRAQAEAELDTIDAWLESGEGDPCDLFVTRWDVPNQENVPQDRGGVSCDM
ncbi:MAG: hypothetical protein WC110_10105 [Bacteroidales bacterium]